MTDERDRDDGLVPAPVIEPGAPGSTQHLDRAFVSGIAWTTAARIVTQVVAWTATIFVARLLTREDFGIWTSAGVYIGMVALLSEFGIGSSVLMLRDLSERQIAQINSIALLIGAAAALLSWALALPIGHFFGSDAVGPVIAAMSIVFLISSLRVVPSSMLQRDLRFRFLAMTDAIKSMLQSIILVSVAAAGLGYWAFPIGIISAEVVWTSIILGARRHRFLRPRLAEIRHAVAFSTDVIVSRLSWYLYSNADFVIAGRRLGQVAQGEYGIAWNMASVPVEKINSIVGSVTPAFFSAVQDRFDELRRYINTLTGAISLLAFPAGVGLALVASDFVHVVLGSQWEASIVPIRLLAIYASIRAIGPILFTAATAIGETRFAMWNNILALLTLPIVFLLGSRWGIAGIAAGWVVAHPLILLALYRRLSSRIAMRHAEYLRSLWPALSGTLAMIAAVLLLSTVTSGLPAAARLPLHAATGAITYGGVLFFFHRERVRQIRRWMNDLRKSAPVRPVPPPIAP